MILKKKLDKLMKKRLNALFLYLDTNSFVVRTSIIFLFWSVLGLVALMFLGARLSELAGIKIYIYLYVFLMVIVYSLKEHLIYRFIIKFIPYLVKFINKIDSHDIIVEGFWLYALLKKNMFTFILLNVAVILLTPITGVFLYFYTFYNLYYLGITKCYELIIYGLEYKLSYEQNNLGISVLSKKLKELKEESFNKDKMIFNEKVKFEFSCILDILIEKNIDFVNVRKFSSSPILLSGKREVIKTVATAGVGAATYGLLDIYNRKKDRELQKELEKSRKEHEQNMENSRKQHEQAMENKKEKLERDRMQHDEKLQNQKQKFDAAESEKARQFESKQCDKDRSGGKQDVVDEFTDLEAKDLLSTIFQLFENSNSFTGSLFCFICSFLKKFFNKFGN